MASLTAAAYVTGVAITAAGVAILQVRRGRWDRSVSDHLVVMGVGLAWPLCLGLFLVYLAHHLATSVKE